MSGEKKVKDLKRVPFKGGRETKRTFSTSGGGEGGEGKGRGTGGGERRSGGGGEGGGGLQGSQWW